MTSIKVHKIEPFIIENAVNSCYIDSLLVGLFLSPSVINNLLISEPKTINAIYLQEYIASNFVENIRNNKSITEDTISMIRTLCYENSWRSNYIKNPDEFLDQQDITEFYEFIINLFNGPMIDIKRSMVTEHLDDNNNISEERIPYIPLVPIKSYGNTTSITVKEMLHMWMYDNCSIIKKDTTNIKCLNTYNIMNIPYIMCMSINRFLNGKDRNTTDVIIQKKINPLSNHTLSFQYEWEFHAAICHIGNTPKSGHYYTLLVHDKKYYIFDDLKIPSIYEVDMSDKKITDKIKKECIFLIYKYI